MTIISAKYYRISGQWTFFFLIVTVVNDHHESTIICTKYLPSVKILILCSQKFPWWQPHFYNSTYRYLHQYPTRLFQCHNQILMTTFFLHLNDQYTFINDQTFKYGRYFEQKHSKTVASNFAFTVNVTLCIVCIYPCMQYLTEAGLISWLLIAHNGLFHRNKVFPKFSSENIFFLNGFLVCLISTNSYYFLA